MLDSDGILQLSQLPRTLTVVGAGVIGLEYASMAAALGAHVTLVEKRPRLLDFVDDELVEALQYHLRGLGMSLRLGEEVAAVDAAAGRRRDDAGSRAASRSRPTSCCTRPAARAPPPT